MTGVVSGGWNFVWAAWIVSAVVLGAWAAKTFAALRTAAAEARPNSER